MNIKIIIQDWMNGNTYVYNIVVINKQFYYFGTAYSPLSVTFLWLAEVHIHK